MKKPNTLPIIFFVERWFIEDPYFAFAFVVAATRFFAPNFNLFFFLSFIYIFPYSVFFVAIIMLMIMMVLRRKWREGAQEIMNINLDILFFLKVFLVFPSLRCGAIFMFGGVELYDVYRILSVGKRESVRAAVFFSSLKEFYFRNTTFSWREREREITTYEHEEKRYMLVL